MGHHSIAGNTGSPAGRPPAAATLRVDMWPDVSDLPPDELCDTPLTLPSGARAQLYSAYNPRTVDRHFRWMQEYALAGAFLQRFTLGLRDPPVSTFRDTVARNVRSAAEANGRVFAIMYDISGHPRDTVVADIEHDWVHLVDALQLTRSPQYLHHRGRPLVAIGGSVSWIGHPHHCRPRKSSSSSGAIPTRVTARR